MVVLDSALIAGLRFVFDNIARAAEAERQDAPALRERLLEAGEHLERGEITQDEFTRIETEVLAAMRTIKGPAQGPLSMSTSAVEVESFDPDR
jgi:hypothetical protein